MAKKSTATAAAAAPAAQAKPAKTYTESYRAARMAGTPIIAIQTIDGRRTMDTLCSASNDKTPFVAWNVVEGWRGLNAAGRAAVEAVFKELGCDASATTDPVENLILAKNLPGVIPAGEMKAPGAVLFLENAHRWLGSDVDNKGADFAQAVFNLRDTFKATQRTVVLLGSQFTFPAELAQHVCVIDEPLPDVNALTEIVERALKGKSLAYTPALLDDAVNALRGICHFGAEQETTMSLTPEGLDINDLWNRKRRLISSTPGLAIWSGGERFSDIGGCDQIKTYFRKVLSGKRRYKVLVFIDEIEKAFAGATSGTADSSGVSQGFLGTLLSEMQDRNYTGTIFVGPPGAAKSATAKAVGGEAGIPTIVLDLAGMKDSLVGSSEARLRQALKVIQSVGDGDAFWIATCNKIAGLPLELRRRFKNGTWYFDLPTRAERTSIWGLYQIKYGITPERAKLDFNDHDWTGAEIAACCELADQTNETLTWASQFIVPVAQANREQINALRSEAAGRYLSAAYPGVYTGPEVVEESTERYVGGDV